MIYLKRLNLYLTIVASLLAVAAVVSGLLTLLKRHEEMSSIPNRGIKSINIYHPYKPVFPLDPRQIYSVGDQVLSEHIFSFHSKESFKTGFQPVNSEIQFNHSLNRITITPKTWPIRSDGKAVSIKEVCAAITSSFTGTQHAPYKSIFVSATCDEKQIIVQLKKIPANLRFLFTLPDFSIYESSNLPIQAAGPFPPTTGPYFISQISETAVSLKRNQHYPSELTANDVDNVSINSYKSAQTSKLVNEMEPETHHLAYLYGHALSEEDEKVLRNKGYRLNYFPSEWITYLTFNPQLSSNDRRIIRDVLDQKRDNLLKAAPLAESAYSISPQDRPFGLTAPQYQASKESSPPKDCKLSKKLTIGILHHWKDIPLFKETINILMEAFPESTVKVFGPTEFKEMQSSSDLALEMLGISPADPLNHLSFLMNDDPNFKKLLDEELLTRVSLIEDPIAFEAAIKEIELKIIKMNLLVPIAHLPGIVAEAPGFERDESLSWSWGTQAWTYRIR